jgi:hypothetical protein
MTRSPNITAPLTSKDAMSLVARALAPLTSEQRKRVGTMLRFAVVPSGNITSMLVTEPPRRRRKPNIATLVKRAEKSGKVVTSITTPDGTTIHFGEPEASEANNPWLDDLNRDRGRVTKQ